MDKFNGFKVGDLIYNHTHQEHALITRLIQEEGPYAVKEPYLEGRYVILTEDGPVVHEGRISYFPIETSRLTTHKDIHTMVLEENIRHTKQINAIEELGKLIKRYV